MSGELESFVTGLPERASAKDLSGIKASYALVVDDGKSWTIHVDAQEITVKDGVGEAVNCTISASEATYTRLIEREIGVMSAYLSGKLKLSGDLGAAMQLSKLLS